MLDVRDNFYSLFTAQPFYIVGNVLSVRAIAKNPPVHAGDGIAMN
jgi:hypothetical protein